MRLTLYMKRLIRRLSVFLALTASGSFLQVMTRRVQGDRYAGEVQEEQGGSELNRVRRHLPRDGRDPEAVEIVPDDLLAFQVGETMLSCPALRARTLILCRDGADGKSLGIAPLHMNTLRGCKASPFYPKRTINATDT